MWLEPLLCPLTGGVCLQKVFISRGSTVYKFKRCASNLSAQKFSVIPSLVCILFLFNTVLYSSKFPEKCQY